MSLTATNMNNGINSTNQLPNQLSNQLPNQMLNQWRNQLPNQLPNQVPNQLPNQLPSQLPNQLPSQLPNQLTSQLPNQLPSQLPNQLPNQLPSQLPNQLPSQLPNQLPSQLPNQLPMNLVTSSRCTNPLQWHNYFNGSQGTANGSSTTPSSTFNMLNVAVRNNAAATASSWYNPHNNPSYSSGHSGRQVSLGSLIPSTVTGNGTYSNAYTHLLHSPGTVSSSSSHAITGKTGNPQNLNVINGLFPTPPTRTAPSSTLPQLLNIPTMKIPKRLAKTMQLEPNPKKPRGRPKKGKTVTFAPAGTNFQIKVYPATATSLSAMLPTTITAMPSTSTSTILAAPSNYVPPMHSRPVLTAAVPVPPNWHSNMEHSVMSLLTFNKYEIAPDTVEYQTISQMLYPIAVTGVEQIVNPDLWDRFVKTRTEMMRSKTDNLNILSKLGLNEKEVMRCAHLSLNFRKDPLLIPYSDNMVLLFHCTRSQTNIKSILSQGLDERLSNISGGLLGKGIYFADDPNKSIQYDGTGYIFIFAVLLGDCISVDHFQNQRLFVREPEKVSQQKRNFNDHFFDSIVARPAGHNEYVIYNRYQCCPIYQIKYDRNSTAGGSDTIFSSSSQKLPPIAWIPSGPNYAMPIQDQTINWPFFAVDLFTSMGVPPPTDEVSDNNDVLQNTPQNTSQTSIDENLGTLMNLGFKDETQNREILTKFNNDIDQTVNYFLDNTGDADDVVVNDVEPTTVEENSIHSTSASSDTLVALGFSDEAKNREILARFNNDLAQTVNYFLDNAGLEGDNAAADKSNKQSIVTIDLIDDDNYCSGDEKAVEIVVPTAANSDSAMDLPDDIAEWALEFGEQNDQTEMEDCPICCNEIPASSWQVFECKHKLCCGCYSKLLTSRVTMSGIKHTFVKCPFCHAIYGTEVGTCPDMQMNISTQHIHCDGYSSFSTLVIDYVGLNFNRTAYLPNNDAGRDVLRLLQIAFERRLCFTVGTSNTTLQQNAIVWNIHHKTATQGGVGSYGYPDPEYLDRVRSELKAFGIQ